MSQRCQRDELWVGILAGAASIAAFLFYFRHDTLLLYGDAVAHINIARRVFDSRDPGPLQLGTVWLPLPHLLILPFVLSRWMWRTGVAGAIPSMLAYVLGALGIFRLLRRGLPSAGATSGVARAAAWFGAIVYAANPNLIYLQTTAMTEPLYLALFIWATVCFSDFVRVAQPPSLGNGSLRNCGVLLLLCMLTRYDGWFAGAVFGVAAAAVFRWSKHAADACSATPGKVEAPTASTAFQFSLLPLSLTMRKFLLLLAAVPLLWFVYNAALWGNPLEFATGPYSAKGIERRTATPTMPHHPGYHSVKVATLFFLKDAKLNMGDGKWQNAAMVLAALGAGLVLISARAMWPLLLLWIPLPFYALSISRGGVPIFFPEWWPHSYYNVRYGLQLLPAIAVAMATLLGFVLRRAPGLPWRVAIMAAALALVGASYASVWQTDPICLREARSNSLTRVPFERKLARELQRLPANATILMYTGDHVGALQRADMPLRRTINETTHPYWKQALVRPAEYADHAVAFGDDAVAAAIKATGGFDPIVVVQSPGQPRTTVFRRLTH